MSDSVAKQTDVVAGMAASGAKFRALMGGTAAMREAGTTYLPKFKAEESEDYQARLASSWLFNATRKTVKDLTGRVFDKPVEIAEAPPKAIEWAENIDMQGRDLSAFASAVFKDGFAAGVNYIMVDAPRRDGQATKAQAAEAGLRPYFVHLRVEDVLGWRTALFGNVTAISQFRIMESVEVPDPDDEFAVSKVDQVRVLDRLPDGVRVRLFRKDDHKKWGLDQEYLTDASEITVVPYYAERSGFLTGEPPLADLVDVNIAHWQSQSDQRHILHKARVPILFGKGIEEDTEITIGASSAVVTRDPQASLEWVEHSGAAIGAGRQDLKDLEFQMQTFGLQLLVARTETATGAALDAAKETSGLAVMADNLKDALEQAFIWALEYGGLDEQPVTIQINKDFGVSMLTAQEVQAMLMAVNTGNLSRATFIEEMKRRGFVRGDLDTADELERIDDEPGLDDE